METEPDADLLETLTQFLYVAPVGLMQFNINGAVQIANPLIAQLLMAVDPASDLTDAYSALGPLVPDLARQVRDFEAMSGVIINHRRCDVTTGQQCRVFSLTVQRAHGGLNLAMLEDVTQVVEQERQIRQNQQRLRAIFENVRDYAIYTVADDGCIDEWNPSLERFGGWRAEDVVGQPLDIFLPPEDRQPAHWAGQLARSRQTGSVETEGWCVRRDGSRFWVNTVVTALPDLDGAVRGFVIVSRDMTERKRMEDELRRLATTDPLTGAFNRRQGEISLRHAFAHPAEPNRQPAVLMLDIDHFKSINDRYGHDTGDIALCSVVLACRQVLGEANAIVRWGGEEFLVVLPNTHAQAAVDVAQRLRVAIRAIKIPYNDEVLRLTVSIGVAVRQDETATGMVARADVALYEAKRTGRDRVVLAR
jgi:diguanylate cyclase (GGDEF)-like protein/PAS domain S-box-containing protein